MVSGGVIEQTGRGQFSFKSKKTIVAPRNSQGQTFNDAGETNFWRTTYGEPASGDPSI
jgi:hypothetical protein